MSDKCDMCGTAIEDGKCSCGTWADPEGLKYSPFKKALEEFHEMKVSFISGEAPHLGCSYVFFRGDYNDCKALHRFLAATKGRLGSVDGMD